ncbi:MAG: RecQ family ATP-dependent DNA helicase [Prevotella sp.]|nr:RecQ family ATP-dependent DNA helicase [Prevotella sp.]
MFDEGLSLLKKYWGYDSFRGIQRDIIDSICAGHDTLGLMPTGGGKSITFQVPALAMEGVCIVITPLIALMKDQVQHLRRRHIRAAAIYTGMSRDAILTILENAIFGAVKLLYVSPERLSSDIFQQKLRHMKVSFICVDEAHCISQWGYDFRPSYLAIGQIRTILPHCPVLALTATATPLVAKDIQDKLSCGQPFHVFQMSFHRPNLAYIVRYATDKEQQLLHILHSVEGAAIVYTRSRQRSKETAELLTKAGLSTTYFHAGLDDSEKDQRQHDWQTDHTRIIVATNAFGMGIDKPDVRLVIHIDCPDSIEAYFQEAGRAGRDGKKAYAVLLYNNHDNAKLRKRISDTFPEKDYLRQVYDQLAYFYQVAVGAGYHATFEFPIDKFCHTYGHFPVKVESALKILNRAGYIEYMEEDENRARLHFCLDRDDLYRLKDNSPNEDAVIVALLRNYSGLFCNEFQYIDESLLAQQTQLPLHQVYLALKELSHRHILNYIPQKKTPYVRYMQRREDSLHLLFPPAVYDTLKERYTERIDQMLHYATTTDQCRSRMLLSYFGEKTSHDCGHCDVCIENKRHPVPPEETEEARQHIMQLLSDRQPHSLMCLHDIPLRYEAIENAIQQMVDEEEVIDDDGFISLP